MSSLKPISVQLYSLRDQCAADFFGALQKIAKMGYRGVEPAGFYGYRLKEVRKVIEDLGMVISSSHTPWANPKNISECVEIAEILGLDMVVCGFGLDDFKDKDAIRRTADQVNSMCASLKKYGLKLFLHNHWPEYFVIDDKLAIDHLAELSPDVLFELDAYWAANFGANDPAAQVAKFKNRTPLLHIKDGPLEKDKAMTALGTGKLDIPAIVKAADPAVLRWVIVELDRCDTDMFAAVEESYKYLTSNQLAIGNL